jgi:hypothetical protein
MLHHNYRAPFTNYRKVIRGVPVLPNLRRLDPEMNPRPWVPCPRLPWACRPPSPSAPPSLVLTCQHVHASAEHGTQPSNAVKHSEKEKHRVSSFNPNQRGGWRGIPPRWVGLNNQKVLNGVARRCPDIDGSRPSLPGSIRKIHAHEKRGRLSRVPFMSPTGINMLLVLFVVVRLFVGIRIGIRFFHRAEDIFQQPIQLFAASSQ